MSIEHRSTLAMVAATDATSAGVSVGGMAIPYESDSEPLPFIESWTPGAFRDQVKEGFGGVTGQFQHDQVFVLASVDSGTMQIVDGALGLRYTMRVPASLGYVQEMVASGVTAGASIGFRAIEDEWSVDPETGAPRRLVTRAILSEISIVASPAFRYATAAIAGGPMPMRSRPATFEQRVGKTISAATHGRLSAIHDSLMDAALGLRDLMDAAKFGTPAEGGFDPDEGEPESDSIPVALSGSPEDSPVAKMRFSGFTASAARGELNQRVRQLARADQARRREQLFEAELAVRRDRVDRDRRFA